MGAPGRIALHVAIVVAAFLAMLVIIARAPKRKEGYGPPPGSRRALSPEELDCRGWTVYGREYRGSSGGALGHMVERSA
jgi:hypothetical protein